MACWEARGRLSWGWLFPHSSTPLSDVKLEELPRAAWGRRWGSRAGGNKSYPVPTRR